MLIYPMSLLGDVVKCWNDPSYFRYADRSMIITPLTHWGRVTHICVSKLTIIGSDNGLSPDRHQAIVWTNAGLLLIGPLGKNLSEILIEILTFSFKKMRLKVSSAKRRPFCLGLNVLNKRQTHKKSTIIFYFSNNLTMHDAHIYAGYISHAELTP